MQNKDITNRKTFANFNLIKDNLVIMITVLQIKLWKKMKDH